MHRAEPSDCIQTCLDIREALGGPQNKVALGQTILQLKQTNRQVFQRLRETKRKNHQAKGTYDRLLLSHQNLLYERGHILAEILDCQNIENLCESIELVPLEALPSTGMQTDHHELMLERLADELARRKQLTEELQTAKTRLETANERLCQARRELESVRDHIRSLLKMAESLRLAKVSRKETAVSSPLVVKEAAALSVDTNLIDPNLIDPNIVDTDMVDTDIVDTDIVDTDIVDTDMTTEPSPLKLLYTRLTECPVANAKAMHFAVDSDPAGLLAKDDEEEGSIEIDDDDLQTAKTHDHGRTTQRPDSVQRRFKHEYVQVPIDGEPRKTSLLFYQATVDRESPVVVTIDGLPCSSPSEIEGWLLDLKLEPALLLTVSHESVVPGVSGAVPFRWLQALAGLGSVSSFPDYRQCILRFFEAVQRKQHDLN